VSDVQGRYTHHMGHVLDSLRTFIADYGYWAVALALLCENAGIPVPGETTLLLASFLAYSEHKLHLGWIIVVGTCAATIGDNIGYAIGHYGGRPLFERYQHISRVSKSTLERGERLFARYGSFTVFFARFVFGLRIFAGEDEEETVAEPLLVHHLARNEDEVRKRVFAALEAAGLHPPAEVSQRYPHHLSGGERQRVVIAAAMVCEPDLVVADEPVSMLDVSVRAEILRLMLDLRKSRELTYVFITHDLSLAWVIADRIAVMYLGRIVEIGPTEDVIRRPKHPYTKSLITVIPSPNATSVERKLILAGEIPSPADIPSGCRFHPRCWLWRRLGQPSRCANEDPLLSAVVGDHSAACHFVEEVDK